MEKITEYMSKNQIDKIVKKLGEEINSYYNGIDDSILVVGLLRGSFVFMADIVREFKFHTLVDFMTVSSYGDKTESSGEVKIIMDLDESISGRDVLIVEDIVDTGRTLKEVISILKTRNPKSIKLCTFLDKPSRRVVDIKADFVGQEIDDIFVVGYGLDYAQKYRNLPFLGIYTP